jgi:hypothetical protein
LSKQKKHKDKPYTFSDYIDLQANKPLVWADFSNIESRIAFAQEADLRREDKMSEFRRRFFTERREGFFVDDRPQGTMTGRFTINQPNPQPLPPSLPRWAWKQPNCACGWCPQSDDTAVETPMHPCATAYKREVQRNARRQADEDWYNRQSIEEERRKEEMMREYRVKFRSRNIVW